jgi:sugar lactone lactonase YvrE
MCASCSWIKVRYPAHLKGFPMESKKKDWKRFKPYFLWGLPFLLALMVALNLLFTYLLNQGWITYKLDYISGINQNSLAFDSSGDAWIGTDNGLVHFNGEKWTTYSRANSGLSDDEIGSISVDSSDNVWVGSMHGLDVFNGEAWRSFDIPVFNIVSTAVDSMGNLWIGNHHDGVTVFDGEDWIRYTQANSGLVSDYVRDIAIDPSGNIWVGTTEGVSVFDGEDWTSYSQANSGLATDGVTDIAFDPSGNIWFGNWHAVSVFDGQHWTTYLEINSTNVLDNIKCVAVDSSGNAWVGTNDRLSYFDGRNWFSYLTNNSGLGHNYIRMIALDPSENVWFGYYRGISMLDPDQAIFIPPWLINLFEYFFSPSSIWITSVSLMILWFAIKEENKYALVGPIGWVLALLVFDPHTIDNEGMGIAIVSNVIAIGALLIMKTDEKRRQKILKRILIALVIAFILGAILYVWIMYEKFSTG